MVPCHADQLLANLYRIDVLAVQAWTLFLLARCHLTAGEAVTAEGLFRAALDGLQGIAEEVDDGIVGSQRPTGAVAPSILFASPIHPYSKAAMLQGYSELLLQWEKREAEGEIAARQAKTASIPQFAALSMSYWAGNCRSSLTQLISGCCRQPPC